jgi:cation transport regulator ChaC
MLGFVAVPVRTSWIFGYGSLIWRPAFRYAARRPGWIEGWQRRLWQRSTDHRGTPDAPGRVATLVPAVDARCGGVAYLVDDAELAAVLDGLHVREQQGYDLIHLDVHLDDGSTAHAATWIASVENPYFAGDEPVAAIAEVVRRSHGPSGSNTEYVLELASALAALGIADSHVNEVAALLQPVPRA